MRYSTQFVLFLYCLIFALPLSQTCSCWGEAPVISIGASLHTLEMFLVKAHAKRPILLSQHLKPLLCLFFVSAALQTSLADIQYSISLRRDMLSRLSVWQH